MFNLCLKYINLARNLLQFKVRCIPEIQELRQWQKEWKEENSNIKNKVDDFWAKQMPNESDCTPPGGSTENINEPTSA